MSDIYCYQCKERPHKFQCNFCSIKLCKLCNPAHACEDNDKIDFAQSVIGIINDLHEVKMKQISEREDNLVDTQAKMIDNFYRERCVKLEEHVEALQVELHEWREKFIGLEESYAEEIEALNSSCNRTNEFESKIKELETALTEHMRQNAELTIELTRRRSSMSSPRSVKFEEVKIQNEFSKHILPVSQTVCEVDRVSEAIDKPADKALDKPVDKPIDKPIDAKLTALADIKKKEIKPKVNTRR